MTVIIPLDISDEFVQAGLQRAAADQLEYAANQLREIAVDLRGGGTVARAELMKAFVGIEKAREVLSPVLDYARAFDDQWPKADEEDADG